MVKVTSELFDFGGTGPVPAYRHINPDKSIEC